MWRRPWKLIRMPLVYLLRTLYCFKTDKSTLIKSQWIPQQELVQVRNGSPFYFGLWPIFEARPSTTNTHNTISYCKHHMLNCCSIKICCRPGYNHYRKGQTRSGSTRCSYFSSGNKAFNTNGKCWSWRISWIGNNKKHGIWWFDWINCKPRYCVLCSWCRCCHV